MSGAIGSLGWLGLLFLLLGGGRQSQHSQPRSGRAAPRAPGNAPPALPAGGPPAPWPQVVPDGLPAFPGTGWEYDEPPPQPVQQRAGQLVSTLWAAGSGSFKIEQTAGRWIAYRAEIVHGGARGVVAYRLKPAQLTAAPQAAPRAAPKPAPRPAAPKAPAPVPAPAPVAPQQQWSSTSPGIPQPVAAPVAPPAATPAAWNVQTGPASPIQLGTLRKGMGLKPAAPLSDVVLLQQKLGIAADGRFGAGTEAAVRIFQGKAGLTPDGIVGPKTWTALFAVRA